jgi:hypothetical protein
MKETILFETKTNPIRRTAMVRLELEDIQQTFLECLEQELEFILTNYNADAEDVFDKLDAAVSQLKEAHWSTTP